MIFKETQESRNKDLADTIEQYSNFLYRLCFFMVKNEDDTQDILQETFITYMQHHPEFKEEEHKKAWLIKVSQNKCRDFLRFHKRHTCADISELIEILPEPEKEESVWSNLWNMNPKYKAVILLHYMVGYSVKEIAAALHLSENAVKKRLQRGREEIKELL